jgi:hypothetical protein
MLLDVIGNNMCILFMQINGVLKYFANLYGALNKRYSKVAKLYGEEVCKVF